MISRNLIIISLIFLSILRCPLKAEAIETKPLGEMTKVIYMNARAVGNTDVRGKIIEFVKKSEINGIIIDVKDYSGNISFNTKDPEIEKLRMASPLCKDLENFIQYLHTHNIYVIARITVFQDRLYAKKFPSQAIQSQKNGTTWVDYKGLPYIDPSSEQFWEYIARISQACKEVGFDEINYDYIRFPTDGDLSDMSFPISSSILEGIPDKQVVAFTKDGTMLKQDETVQSNVDNDLLYLEISPKVIVLHKFFKYLHQQVRERLSIPISADLFGMVLTVHKDYDIGQVLEMAAPYFDYIAPMIYPSHYRSGFQGFKQPANHPYEIVSFVLKKGISRLERMGVSAKKLRPWLQDFNFKAIYDVHKVHAQKKAVYDVGLTSWFVWNPRSIYSLEKYLP